MSRLDIAARMRKALPELEKGFGGVPAEGIRPEWEDGWSADYAIVIGAMAEEQVSENELTTFDEFEWNRRLLARAVELFSTRERPAVVLPFQKKIKVTDRTPKRATVKAWLPVGTVVIRHWTGSSELEVYRLREDSK